MRDRFRVAPLGVALGLAIAASGCGPARHSSATEPPTARPAPSTPTAVSRSVPASARPREAALAAYRGMWGAFAAAARSSNAADPVLARYASGGALRLLRKSLRADRAQGVVTRGRLVLNPRVTKVGPEKRPRRVWVRDCADASHWLRYERASGRRTGGKAGRHHAEALVELSGGRWRVSAFFVEKAGTC